MKELTLYIEKMDCPDEERIIRSRLNRIASIKGLSFDLVSRQLNVVIADQDTDLLFRALESIGMFAQLVVGDSVHSSESSGDFKKRQPIASQREWIQLGIAFLLAIASEVLSVVQTVDSELLVAALSLLAIVLGGRTMLKKGILAVRALSLGINFLMTIAVAGALLIGEWPEAAMVTVLFELAERIEAYAMDRSRDAIRTLIKLAPAMSHVADSSGGWHEIRTSAVDVGQKIRIAPGDLIPLDGLVISGSSNVNQASITGESMPVAKEIDDDVFAGTLNENGALVVEVTGKKNDTTLSRIIKAVKSAQAERGPTQRFVDVFSRYYTPIVVGIAFLVVIVPVLMGQPFMLWLYRSLVMLVIACPCALVISTPVTVVSGLTAATRAGILIKGGSYLENGHRLKLIAVDKTGTLTEGRPQLVDIQSIDADLRSKDDVLRLAASLNAQSEHTIARAFLEARENLNTESDLHSVTSFRAIAGRGVAGIIDGVSYGLGNHRYAHESGSCNPEIESRLSTLEKQGQTSIVLFTDKKAVAVFGVADTLRYSSFGAIKGLQEMGIRVVMLTGDNVNTAKTIAGKTGIDQVYADLLPEEKLSLIAKLRSEFGPIGMVGDGINDAPALVKSDIGFAMGTGGSDVAIESADVALVGDDLRKISAFITLSKKTAIVLRQNIAFAIGIKTVFLVLAIFGIATLWMAVVADMGASLLVTFNGLRLASKN